MYCMLKFEHNSLCKFIRKKKVSTIENISFMTIHCDVIPISLCNKVHETLPYIKNTTDQPHF